MSVCENVHAVVSGRHRRRSSEMEPLTDHPHHSGNHSSDDDIDVIEKCLSNSHSVDQFENSHGFTSTYHALDSVSPLPPPEPVAVTRSRDRLRRQLKYYFMSPIDKWRAKGRIPYKLCLQAFKIVFVTLQLIIFGIDMSNYMTLESNVAISLRKLFLQNWDALREVMTYPPAAGPYAIYEREQVFESIDYALHRFANLSQISVGSFGYQTPNQTLQPMSPFEVCVDHYSTARVNPSEYYYYIDNKIETDCIAINNTYPPGDDKWRDFHFRDFIAEQKFELNFEGLVGVTVRLPLRTIYLNSLSIFDAPECYDIDVKIEYDNSQHSGQILVVLTAQTKRQDCNGNLKDNEEQTHTERQVLNVGVILICLLSFFLCMRSMIRGQKLKTRAIFFFRKHFGKELTFQETSRFIDGWILMIIVNDILIIAGSCEKINMERNNLHGAHYNYCSLMLGFGNLLVWCGLLRYLSFFKKYNILIVTLKHCLPHVLRFLLCALILYAGFCFCGWVVLGPYHFKFRTISRTSECLFALMNGDDLFATFAITNTNSLWIWWFSRLYLYGFIVLFIYVVISLFIAIIMDSYETIKDYYQNGFPLDDLEEFVSECEDTMASYMEDMREIPTFWQSLVSSWSDFKQSVSSMLRIGR